ncbi:MAG TPA: MOSC domain-containing protein [Dehalococcoidia bacterium]|nr:MOSC domain-containing protein [Dehalococcoidia bacterium]
MSERRGRVLAVCLSPRGGIPKFPQDEVVVGPHGIEGDYHSGAFRTSRRSGQAVPNLRQVSVCAQEVYDELEAQLGVRVPPGGFSENVLVEGLGDLGDLEPGDVLHFSGGVEVEVTDQNVPCANLSVYHPLVPKLVYGRRGIVGVVRTAGVLRPGETVAVRRAAEEVQVEAYAGAFHPQRPLRVLWRGRWWGVREVVGQARGPGRRLFTVLLEDDVQVTLCYYEGQDRWTLRALRRAAS